MPSQLRDLFALICFHGLPRDALKLFEDNIKHLSEDFLQNHSTEIARHLALKGIEIALDRLGKNLKDYGLPQVDTALLGESLKEAYQNEEEPTMQDHLTEFQLSWGKFNTEQKNAYNSIMETVNNENIHPRQFFLDGPGGTGKTFLYNAIARKVIIVFICFSFLFYLNNSFSILYRSCRWETK